MKEKNKMPSRKIGGVYSPCMETVLIGALHHQVYLLNQSLSDDLGDFNKNQIEEDINTLKYFIQKANKKRYKTQQKEL